MERATQVACSYANLYLNAKDLSVRLVARDLAVCWAIAAPVSQHDFEQAERAYREVTR